MEAIVWLRRDLRLYDHSPISIANKNHENFLPIFIFDETILKRFDNKQDRRLTFLANTIIELNKQLEKYDSEILVLYGSPQEIIPKLADILEIKNIYAGQDFEPETIKRDLEVSKKLEKIDAKLHLSIDHILLNPADILKSDGTIYKVFTPFSKVWKERIRAENFKEQKVNLKQASFVKPAQLKKIQEHLQVISTNSAEEILEQIGYNKVDEKLWKADEGIKRLDSWLNKISKYKDTRDFPGINGTSALSPYLRFGLVSIRHTYREAHEFQDAGSYTWINELIWREFYIYILFHYPHTTNLEFQEHLQKRIPWRHNEKQFELWKAGKTGYPIVDAAMRQLLQDGWMHNRSRMIVASFLCKNLLIDWRLGEEHFAQYLMDYEAASNIGGWQWSASTGTDAQPYFRVFNPILQSKKFDPDGEYIRKYLPELKNYKGSNIHEPYKDELFNKYHQPIVELDITRKSFVEIFEKLKKEI